ncbi:MAG: hypothetical protein ACOYXT_11200 [Bacteroidota bacterium]
MKNLAILFVVFAGAMAGDLLAQTPVTMGSKEKMKVFAGWVGRWQGEGSMQMGPGEPRKSTVEEKIEAKLDGSVYLVEGLGKAINPETKQEMVVHQALAVLSYDQVTSQYKFRTFLKDGRGTDAWFTVTGENTYQWGFDIPSGGKSRYTIIIDPVKKTWNEIGEYARDGSTWSKFFEMNLKKVD